MQILDGNMNTYCTILFTSIPKNYTHTFTVCESALDMTLSLSATGLGSINCPVGEVTY